MGRLTKRESQRTLYLKSLETSEGTANFGDITFCAFCKKEYVEWREYQATIDSFKICQICHYHRWSKIIPNTFEKSMFLL